MRNYRLNLDQQSNGDYEVHEEDCRYWPTRNYDSLGSFSSCRPAMDEAKRKHPFKSRINGCKTCCESCHTT